MENKMFPIMLEEPDPHTVGTGLAYWLFAFLLMPALISLPLISGLGLTDDGNEVWFEMGYHGINFVVVFLIFFGYLRDALFTAWLNFKKIFGTAALCAAAIVVLKLVVMVLAVFTGNALFAEVSFGTLLTTEADLMFYSTALMAEQPLWGTLFAVLLAPMTVSCLYYGSVFAPVCTSRPKLAYLLAALTPVLARLLQVFALWSMQQQMAIYIIQIPIHLIACWSYQKTDTIWTPILTHLLSNLALALLLLWFMSVI